MIPIGTVRCWTWRPTCWDNGPAHTGVGFSEYAPTVSLSIDCYRPLSACVHVECPTGTDRLPSYPQKPSNVPRHASHGGRAHPSGMGYTLSPLSHGRPVPPDLSRPSFLIFFSRGTVRRHGLFLYHDRVRSFLWTGMTMMNTRNRMEWIRNGIPFPRHGLWMTARECDASVSISMVKERGTDNRMIESVS